MDDYKLTDKELQCRIGELFSTLDCKVVIEPRFVKDDLLIEPPTDWLPQIKIAVEAKGPKSKERLTTRDLRQLDDWVFDLSGEKDIRRRSLIRWKNPLLREQDIGTPELGMTILETAGAVPYSPVHPSPVKGLLVFNGPTNKSFEDRSADWFPSNERKFAEIRSFCVLSLESLLRWVEACEYDDQLKQLFWLQLHETFGLCPDPPT